MSSHNSDVDESLNEGSESHEILSQSCSPLPLVMSTHSSRCSTPISMASDLNEDGECPLSPAQLPPEEEFEEEEEEDDTVGGSLNLTMPSASKMYNNGHYRQQLSPPSPNMNDNGDEAMLQPYVQMKPRQSDSVLPKVSKQKKQPQANLNYPLGSIEDLSIFPSTDCVQLLLEYRQVLLDVLAKSIMSSDENPQESMANKKGALLPLKCHCGFNSKLSNQITRTSTYVHQLELRLHSLVDSSRNSVESKYTPKRPWFVNSAAAASTPFPSFPKLARSSLLDKKSTALPRMSMNGKQNIPSMHSGSSNPSSANGDEDDADSDDDNMPINMNNNEFNGQFEQSIPGNRKTILEGYLESMRSNGKMNLNNNNRLDEFESDSEERPPGDDDEYDHEETPFTPEIPNGPGKRIDTKTKNMAIQLQRNGFSITDISRMIGISRKSVRRIVSTFQNIEKQRNSIGAHELILRLYSQGKSYTQISQATQMTKQAIAKTIKMYIDANITKNSNGSMPVTTAMNNALLSRSLAAMSGVNMTNGHDGKESDHHYDDDQDMNDNDHDQHEMPFSMKKSIDTLAQHYSQVPQQKSNSKQFEKRKNMSLIHGFGNGNMNGNSSRYSLMQQNSDHRFKPYETKGRHSSPSDLMNTTTPQQRMSMMNPIVPPLNKSSANLYAAMQRPKLNSNRINSSNSGNHTSERDDRSFKNDLDTMRFKNGKIKDSLMVPEADKNNNTTLNNCNMTITASTKSSPSSDNLPHESTLPPIPASIIDSSVDSDAKLVPKTFVDGFPAGIMNSLNPNRATKLTLEDFDVVWKLRSQHWTHNQIRKYFQQRGKSISKSSISRIMNGKQRNFQQFFNLAPSEGQSAAF